MKLTVRKKELAEAIAKATPAISKRATLPVLSGVKVSANDSAFTVEATDLEAAIAVEGSATSSVPGAAVVPAASLTKALQSLNGDEVTIDLTEDEQPRIEVSSGGKRIVIDGFALSDWPTMTPSPKWGPVCDFDSRDLADALGRIVRCASHDDARPVLTGIQFNIGNGHLELVATDSYRLGVISLDVVATDDAEGAQLLVPSRIAKALAKQLKKDAGRGAISVVNNDEEKTGNRLVQFSFRGVRWITREIEGDYPNWRRLVPERSGASLEFDSAELASAAKGAAALRSSKSVPVKLSLGDTCALTMSDSGVADVEEQLLNASFSGNGVGQFSIAFNPDFLIDGVRFVGGDRCTMWLSDPVKPVLFLGEADGRYVLMPVRIAS